MSMEVSLTSRDIPDRIHSTYYSTVQSDSDD